MNAIDFYNYALNSLKSNAETHLRLVNDDIEALKSSSEWLPLDYFSMGHQRGDLTKNTIIYEQDFNVSASKIVLTPYVVYQRYNVGSVNDLTACYYDIYFKINGKYYIENQGLNIQQRFASVIYEAAEGGLYSVSSYLNFRDNATTEIIFGENVSLEKMYIVCQGADITEPSPNLPYSWAAVYGNCSFSGMEVY